MLTALATGERLRIGEVEIEIASIKPNRVDFRIHGGGDVEIVEADDSADPPDVIELSRYRGLPNREPVCA